MSTESPKDAALHQISKIVDQVFEDSEVYREEIDRAEFMQYFSHRFDNGLSPEEYISTTEAEITRIVRQLMAVDVLSGLLSDLTPEEIRTFNEAVEGRQLFCI